MRGNDRIFIGEKLEQDTVTCIQCGGRFRSWYSKARFCSAGCKVAFNLGGKSNGK